MSEPRPIANGWETIALYARYGTRNSARDRLRKAGIIHRVEGRRKPFAYIDELEAWHLGKIDDNGNPKSSETTDNHA